jgi:putative nucleotidyltransferase-like protein
VTRFAAAGTPIAGGAMDALLAEVSWEGLGQLLIRLRLVELAGAALQELCGNALPDEFAPWVEQTRQATSRRAAVHELVLGRALSALSAAGIPAAPLKGVTLANDAFGRLDLRASVDLDVLVYARDLGHARAVLMGLGWDAPDDVVDSEGLPLHHFRLYSAKAPTVELHWRMHWYERDFCREALDRATPASGSLRLRHHDHLALLLIGYARDGFRGLRVPADIAALSARGRPLDPARVPDALQGSLVAAAVAVRELLRVCPIDPVDPRVVRRRRLRAALALWDPLLRLEGTKSWADVALTDLLLAPPAGLGAALHRRLWPPLATIPAREHAGAVRARVPHLEHLVRTVRGFAIALPRVARAMGPPKR